MQAEEIMEKKIASAMEVCKKYNHIKADGKKAEAVWRSNLIWVKGCQISKRNRNV